LTHKSLSEVLTEIADLQADVYKMEGVAKSMRELRKLKAVNKSLHLAYRKTLIAMGSSKIQKKG